MLFKKTNPAPKAGPETGWRRWYRVGAMAILTVLAVPVVAYATSGGPVDAVNSLTDLFVTLIKAIGGIAALFGILQFATSFQSHDPSQRTNGILIFVGGLLIYFAEDILSLIGITL